MAANIHSATVRCRLARTTSSSFCHSPVPDLCNDWNFVRACCLRYERLETNLDGSSAERERYCQEWCTRADQAATLLGCCFLVTRTSFFTSIPSRNLTPSTTFASHSKPRSRRQLRSADCPSL